MKTLIHFKQLLSDKIFEIPHRQPAVRNDAAFRVFGKGGHGGVTACHPSLQN
jgi:hypothetical protein